MNIRTHISDLNKKKKKKKKRFLLIVLYLLAVFHRVSIFFTYKTIWFRSFLFSKSFSCFYFFFFFFFFFFAVMLNAK